MSGDGWDKANFGYIDPSTGKYTAVSSFNLKEPDDPYALEISPDLTKYATSKAETPAGGSPLQSVSRVGWIDSSGKFTAVSPAPPPATDFQRSLPPMYGTPVFDGAGNFYYSSSQGEIQHLYKLPAGATSNPQEVTPTPQMKGGVPLRNFDGTLNFACSWSMNGKWLGPDSLVAVIPNIGLSTSPSTPSSDYLIAKIPIVTASDGCPATDSSNQNAVQIFDIGMQTVDQPVVSPDGTKIAFFNENTPGGLYVLDIKGNGKPTRIAAKSDLNLSNLKLIRWN